MPDKELSIFCESFHVIENRVEYKLWWQFNDIGDEL